MSARLADPRYLVGHWTLQGHLEDVSGYGQHMTWEGSGFGEGYENNQFGLQAAVMDGGGSGDYLRHAVANWRSGDTKGTITAWIMRSAASGFPTIFASSDEATSARFLLLHIRNSPVSLSIERVNASGTDRVRGTTVLALNRWYHVAFVSTGTSWQIYLDGEPETLVVEAGVNSGDWLADIPDRDNFTIGNLRHFAPVIHWEGDLGGIRAYNVDLTAAEVKRLFLAPVPRLILPEQPIPQAPDLTDSALVGAWLNKLTVGTPDDASPNGYGATLVGVPTMEKVGVGLDGAADALNLGDIAELDSVVTFTLAGWFYWDALGAWMRSFSKYAANDVRLELGTSATSSALAFIVSNGVNVIPATGAGVLAVGRWIHIVAIYDGSLAEADRVKVLVDSVEQALSPTTGVPTNTGAMPDAWLGALTGGGSWMNGEVRDFRIYSDAKNIAWAKEQFLRGVPNPNLVYHLAGDCTRDLSRFRRPLIINDAVVGKHIDTDGSADSFIETAAQIPELSGATQVSVSFWSYLRADAGWDQLFGKMQDAWFAFDFHTRGNGYMEFGLANGVVFSWAVLSPPNAVVLNRWRYFLLTYDGGLADADKVNIYINGVSQSVTLSGTIPSALYTGTELFGIGGAGSGGNGTTDGLADDFKLFIGEIKSADWAKAEYLKTRKYY